jgi:hypothetical protein
MEQRLEAKFLGPSLFERAAAIGVGAVSIGTAILLASWGISLLWRYTPPEIAVRISNPEVRVTQTEPLIVTQDKPFMVTQSEPFRVEPKEFTVRMERSFPSIPNMSGGDSKTTVGDAIKREVTQFFYVKHGPGGVTTGWQYQDGSGGKPIQQYCYYNIPNLDGSDTKIDIASNGTPSINIGTRNVPDLDGALQKCQWWQG